MRWLSALSASWSSPHETVMLSLAVGLRPDNILLLLKECRYDWDDVATKISERFPDAYKLDSVRAVIEDIRFTKLPTVRIHEMHDDGIDSGCSTWMHFVDCSRAKQTFQLTADGSLVTLDLPKDCADPFLLKIRITKGQEGDFKFVWEITVRGCSSFRKAVTMSIPYPDGFPVTSAEAIISDGLEAIWSTFLTKENMVFDDNNRRISLTVKCCRWFMVKFYSTTGSRIKSSQRQEQILAGHFHLPQFTLLRQRRTDNLLKFKIVWHTLGDDTKEGNNNWQCKEHGLWKFVGTFTSAIPVVDGDVLPITISPDLSLCESTEYHIIMFSSTEITTCQFLVEQTDRQGQNSQVIICAPLAANTTERIGIFEIEDPKMTFVRKWADNFRLDGRTYDTSTKMGREFHEWRKYGARASTPLQCMLDFIYMKANHGQDTALRSEIAAEICRTFFFCSKEGKSRPDGWEGVLVYMFAKFDRDSEDLEDLRALKYGAIPHTT